MMQRSTPEQRAVIAKILHKINAATEGEDPDMVIQALIFMLFGCVQSGRGLSQRETVDYVASKIKLYGQTVFS